MKSKSISWSEHGQSMMEFAFGLVFLFVLISGIADGGRALFTYMTLRDAAQEGALYGSTNPTDTEKIVERVCNSSNYLQGTSCDDPANSGATVKVVTQVIGQA